MSKKTRVIIGGAILLGVVSTLMTWVLIFFKERNSRSLFELSNGSEINKANLFSVYSGTFVSANNELLIIKLHQNGGIFSGIKVTSKTEIMQTIKEADGSFRQEKKFLKDIPTGALIDVTISHADPASPFDALRIRYE